MPDPCFLICFMVDYKICIILPVKSECSLCIFRQMAFEMRAFREGKTL